MRSPSASPAYPSKLCSRSLILDTKQALAARGLRFCLGLHRRSGLVAVPSSRNGLCHLLVGLGSSKRYELRSLGKSVYYIYTHLPEASQSRLLVTVC